MKHLLYFAMSMALASGCAAQALRGPAEVSIIDRETGAALNAHYHHGEYWVAGRPGGRYAVEIHNRLGERLLAVTSIDGVNVVSGATAAWDQGGYVFGPGERYQITGWRKSDAEVAAFTFTDLRNSYAARTGRPANVGVIGVAVFRERRPPAIANEANNGQPTDRSDSARAAQSSPAAPQAGLAEPSLKARLGTGHGEREYSYADHTEFLRMQSQPDQVVRIHYDSLDNLFAMGILPRPRAAPASPDPFPGSREQQYVPDPAG